MDKNYLICTHSLVHCRHWIKSLTQATCNLWSLSIMSTSIRTAYSRHALAADLGGLRTPNPAPVRSSTGIHGLLYHYWSSNYWSLNMDNNLFAGLEGADIDRLVQCMDKVRKEGLKLDKWCQAGVNQSSGNVYIWSEDWTGCVYCSIGFDVSWSYSCSDCGEEYEFDTEQECREYAEKHDYKCQSCNPENEGVSE